MPDTYNVQDIQGQERPAKQSSYAKILIAAHQKKLQQGYRTAGRYYKEPRLMTDRRRGMRHMVRAKSGTKYVDAPMDLRQYKKPPEAEFATYTPPMTPMEAVEQMPNWERLTPSERFIYNRLPGVMDTVSNAVPGGVKTTWERTVGRFDWSWMGKALGVIDVLAEGAERASGFVAQWNEAAEQERAGNVGAMAEFQENLGHAWTAGSLAADVTNIPGLKRDEDGKVVGLELPDVLPGMAGMVDARKKLAQGMPLEQVKGEYYDSLGALQIRAQMHDMYFHILGDPLNYILPQIAVVEKAQAARYAIMGMNKLDDAMIDALRVAETAAKAANRMDDAAIIANKIATAKPLTRMDRVIMTLTGGDPLAVPQGFIQKGLKSKWNPFALTPSARAHEYATMVTDHVGSHILANIDDPAEIVATINRAYTGFLGDDFGHAFLNLEGRTAQAALAGFDATAQDLLTAYNKSAEERELLYRMARTLDVDHKALLNDITVALKEETVEGANKVAGIAKMAGEDAKKVTEMGQMLDKVPVDPSMFKAYLTNKLADHAAKQAVAQFGIKARGFAEKLSLAIKSGETLAFLRLNPAYAMRNMYNNEFTMVARGMGGYLPTSKIDDTLGRIGFEPIRFSQGFGAAGAELQYATKIGKDVARTPGEIVGGAIYEALRGERGALDKAQEAINSIKLGKLDASYWAAAHERAASRRASVQGFLEGMRKYYWKPGKGFDKAEDFLQPSSINWINQNRPGITKAVQDAVASALNKGEIDEAVKGNLNLNITSILDDANQRAGFDVGNILGADFIAAHEQDMIDAATKGRTAVDDLVNKLKREMDEGIDELLEHEKAAKTAEVAARVEQEGAHALTMILGDEIDRFWGAHYVYTVKMSELEFTGARLPREVARGVWQKLKGESRTYYDRVWDSFDATFAGIKEGAKKKGLKIPDGIETSYVALRKKNTTFIKSRDKLWDDFFAAMDAGKTPKKKITEIRKEIDTLYGKLIDEEQILNKTADDAIASLVPEGMTRDLFVEWRRKSRELRVDDKTLVRQFNNEIANVRDPKQKSEMYRVMFRDRSNRMKEIWENDRRGLAMLSGDQRAIDELEESMNMAIAYYDTIYEAAQKGFLNNEDVRLVDQFIDEFATPAERDEFIDLTQRLQTIESGEGIPHLLTGEIMKSKRFAELEAVWQEVINKVVERVTGRSIGVGLPFLDQALMGVSGDANKLRRLAAFYGLRGEAKEGIDQRIVNTINKYLGLRFSDDFVLKYSRKGHGYVPFQDVTLGRGISDYPQYHTVRMKPSEFESLVPKRPSAPSEFLTEARRKGDEFAPSWLDVDWDDEAKVWRVVSHEGRGRAWLAKDVDPDKDILVDLMYRSSVRRDQITDEMLNAPILAQPQAEDITLQVPSRLFTELRYETLDDIPLDAARNAFNKMAAEKGITAETVETAVKQMLDEEFHTPEMIEAARKMLVDWENKKLSEIDPEIANLIRHKVDEMAREASTFDPKRRFVSYEQGAGEAKTVTAKGSEGGLAFKDVIDWWEDIPKNIRTRPKINKAVEQILHGDGYIPNSKLIPTLRRIALGKIKKESPVYHYLLGDMAEAQRLTIQWMDHGFDNLEEVFGAEWAGKLIDNLGKPAEELRRVRPVEYDPKAYSGMIDFHSLMPRITPQAMGDAEYAFARKGRAIEELGNASINQASKTPLKWDDLPDEVADDIRKYIDRTKGQLSDARYASVRYAEFKRDSALLNYNRRFNYNTYLGMIAPYEFWFTQSIGKWALHTLDRPAMLSSYLRIQKMIETSGAPNQELPTRLRGKIRISLPFLPEWMTGDLFVDPLRSMLPFDSFMFGYEQLQYKQTTREGRAERLLKDQVADGKLTPADAEQAIMTKQGLAWDAAVEEVIANDSNLKSDVFDTAMLLTPPHAPLVWAKEVAEGTPEDIMPFTPMSRTAKGIAGLFGIDWTNHPLNIEAKVRKSLGLPAYDKWDDYRVERMLSNMAADGKITTDQALRGIMDHSGEHWELATERANKEFGIGTVGSNLLGIPMQGYATGELQARSLRDEFYAALNQRDNGNTEALTTFFETYPEYETRLALFKEPEERLRQYLVDEIWDRYWSMNDINQRETKEQLGLGFEERFFSSETRSYESIPIADMQTWLKLMGGDPPGTLQSETSFDEIELTDPAMANHMMVFYDNRRMYFPDYKEMQNTYFDLKKGKARKKYLRDNPQLKEYWNWRDQYFHDNPTIVPYLDDDYEFEYESVEEREAAYAGEPSYTWAEWSRLFSQPMKVLMLNYANGGDLPDAGLEQIEDIADMYGLTTEHLLEQVSSSIMVE